MSEERVPGDKAAARAEAQRGRILDAAQTSFIDGGFHAATMATIAQRAGVSAGLIYRYFENKEAIVLAIIERELQRRRARIATLSAATDLVEGFVATFAEMHSGSAEAANAVLFLEMSAEGTRVPRIAQALEAADRRARQDLEAIFARDSSRGGMGLAPERAASAALLIQLLFEGLAVRATREPGLDPERLRRALRRALQPSP